MTTARAHPTLLGPPSPGAPDRAPGGRATRSPHEYAHLSRLFADLARLPTGHGRRAALRDRLIIEHLPLARHIARRFARRGESLPDLEQVATVGLINAVDRFDPDRGCEFLAFAVPTITGEVMRWFRDGVWSVRVPRRLKDLDRAIRAAVDPLSQELRRAPRPSEIAARVGVEVAEVIEGLQARDVYRCLSLDEPLGPEPDDESLLSCGLGELDPGLALVEEREALGPLLDALADRERQVLLLRFFGNMTQTQIAREIGISQMHVSRLLTATLERLRQALTADA